MAYHQDHEYFKSKIPYSAIENAEKATATLKAVSNYERLLILFSLAEGEKYVTQISERLEIKQARISQRLIFLKAAGLVRAQRQGTKVYYSIPDEKIRRFIQGVMETR